MNAATAPAPVRTAIRRWMRARARPRNNSSGSIFFRILQEAAEQLHETGHGAQDQEDQIEEMGAERLVQQIADEISDEACGRQQKSERGVLAHLDHRRLLHRFALSSASARSAVSCTRKPIFGWLGSKSG